MLRKLRTHLGRVHPRRRRKIGRNAGPEATFA